MIITVNETYLEIYFSLYFFAFEKNSTECHKPLTHEIQHPPAPPSLHTDSLCNDRNPWVKNIDRSDGCSVCVYHFNNVLTAVQFILVHVGHLRHSGYLRRLDHLRHMGHLRHLKSIVSTSL